MDVALQPFTLQAGQVTTKGPLFRRYGVLQLQSETLLSAMLEERIEAPSPCQLSA